MELLATLLSNYNVTTQNIVDTSLSMFNTPWYRQYFATETPSTSLRFSTILAQDGIIPMAAVIDRESGIPLLGNAGFQKLDGEVPAIAISKTLKAEELRQLEMLADSRRLGLQDRANAVINTVFDHVRTVVNSVEARLNYMVMQGLSTGSIIIQPDNNPAGIVLQVPILDKANILSPGKKWTDAAADIIADLETLAEKAGDKGFSGKILLSRKKWSQMAKNKSVTDYLKGFANPGSNARFTTTLNALNEALGEDNLALTLELVDSRSSVEIDGKTITIEGWNSDNIVLVPNGQIGVIHNSFADEQITPVDGIDYATVRNIHVRRWRDRKPVREWTEAEYNAFPGFTQANNTFILQTA